MKTSAFLSAFALSLLAVVPASANESEYTYDEFEINDLPETQEEDSSWEFSVGVEGVFGQAQMSASAEQSVYVPGKYWWEDGSTINQKTEVDFEAFYGFNFRLNWLKSPEKASPFSPEVYVLLGFMTGATEEKVDKNLTLLSCTAGGNMHLHLSETFSIFGGVRLGGGVMFPSGGGHGELSSAVTYGVGAGALLHLGSRGDSIRLGVDYLMSAAEVDDDGFQVSDPEWVLFSVGYNVSF